MSEEWSFEKDDFLTTTPYCRMCGGEFLERREQTFCPKCRTMRKRQAQKKYAVLHARGRL